MKGDIMNKTKTKSFMLTEEEDRIVQAYIKQRIVASDERITQSDIFRELILKAASSNGNSAPAQDTKQDDKQEDKPVDNPTTPTETPSDNPFSDLSFD